MLSVTRSRRVGCATEWRRKGLRNTYGILMKSCVGALSIPYARLVIFVIPELPVAMGLQLADQVRSEFRAAKTTV